jgi:hypothetical protein
MSRPPLGFALHVEDRRTTWPGQVSGRLDVGPEPAVFKLGTMLLLRIHLWLGISTLLVFLLTGQFMDKVLGHLVGMADGPRMLYRSAHIYLLWSGLLNVSFGLYPIRFGRGWGCGVKRLGSVFIFATPPLLLMSFFLEPHLNDFERPYSRAANYLAVVGVLMHLLAGRQNSLRESSESQPDTELH